jgi:hypothetical protein
MKPRSPRPCMLSTEITNQLGNCARKPPSLAVALNCGTGSSFLKALVKAFDKLHMVLAANSGYCGSKYRRRYRLSLRLCSASK